MARKAANSSGEAATNYQIIAKAGLPVQVHAGDPIGMAGLRRELAAAEWVVDALFGTGLRGPVRSPFDQVIAAKISARILAAIDELPIQQREVVTLRDVQGLSSGEVCAVLDISNANQRVLLHRGRSKLRQVIGSEFGRGR